MPDDPHPESLLALAERHVREGAARLERQRQIVEELERDHHLHAAETARGVLATMEVSLALARRHLGELRLHRPEGTMGSLPNN